MESPREILGRELFEAATWDGNWRHQAEDVQALARLEADELLALIRPAIEAEARQQGRKDVVDWMFTHMVKDSPEHEPYRGLIAITKEMWQAQCQKWGIK